MAEPPVTVEAEGVRPEVRKTGHKWLDFIVAGSAILISLVSLSVAIHHGEVQERLVAANSWPFLQATTANRNEAGAPEIRLGVNNGGVGPALLRSVRLIYQGRAVRNSDELLTACCGGGAALNDLTSSRLSGRVLAAGDRIAFLSLARTEANSAAWDRLNTARFRITYEACYCSVLGDCWRSDLAGLEPTAVASCPREPAAYTE